VELQWTIELANEDDAVAIFDLQRVAFQSEAEIYHDPHIRPLTETLEDSRADFDRQVVFKAAIDGRVVGSVRGHLRDGTCHIGRLVVHPELRNRGIGTALMRHIERHFSGAHRFELFTGEASEGNLHLYGKLGYREFDRRRVTDNVTMVLMEKGPPVSGTPATASPGGC
jgi:ribosomal protein S18 acetylase RimI-like enzyme